VSFIKIGVVKATLYAKLHLH